MTLRKTALKKEGITSLKYFIMQSLNKILKVNWLKHSVNYPFQDLSTGYFSPSIRMPYLIVLCLQRNV